MATFVPQFTNPNPIDPSVVGKLAPPQQTSLGDMLNLARGAQAYQQAQQINPLQLQAAQIELQKAQDTLQPTIRKAETEAQTSQLALDKNKMIIAGNALTGLEYSDAFKTNDIPQLKKQFETTQKWLESMGIPAEKTFAQAHDFLDKKDIGGFKSMVQNIRNGLASSSEQFAASQPSLQTVGGQPALVTTGGPTPGITTPQYNPQGGPAPFAPTQEGVQPVAPPKQITGQDLGQPPKAGDINTPIPPMFPVRKPGVVAPPPTTQEVAAQAQGDKYFNSVIEAQPKLAQQTRNVQEIVKTAQKIESEAEILGKKIPTSGWAGDAYRKIYGGVGGTEYQELAKDLANAQMSLMSVGGSSLSSDQGKQLAASASGTVSTNPEVIIKIAERTAADIKNLDSQAEAAQKFVERFGTNNMGSFQRMWGKNADTKVFQVMNIVDNVEDPKQREALFKKLYTSEKEMKEGLQKYKNIRKLMLDGTL
jgi:hypothetical protein